MSICLICTFHFRSINNINHFATLRLVAKISVMQDLSESYKHAIYGDALIFWTTQRRAVSDSRILFEYIPLHQVQENNTKIVSKSIIIELKWNGTISTKGQADVLSLSSVYRLRQCKRDVSRMEVLLALKSGYGCVSWRAACAVPLAAHLRPRFSSYANG